MFSLFPHTETAVRFAGLAAEKRLSAIQVGKVFHTESGDRTVLENISFSVGVGDRLAILGRNGSGKSTLIKILSGLLRPTFGRIERRLKMSWPLAFGGGFEGALTGYDNVRFISKIYGCPFKETFAFVEDFTELGRQLHTEVRFYSDGMKMRLAFALSLAIRFECYLIDEVLVVGDRRFQQKCEREIIERKKHSAMIIAIHDMTTVKEFCTSALILKEGQGRIFNDLNLAADIYLTL